METFLAKTQIVIRPERFSEMLSPITTLHLNRPTNSCRKLINRLEKTPLHYSRNSQFLLPCIAKIIFSTLSLGVSIKSSLYYLKNHQ